MEITRGQWIIIILLTLSFIATAGFIAFATAAVLSFGPAYLYLKSIRNAEETDKEPWSALQTVFIWGAVSGVFYALILNSLGGSIVFLYSGNDADLTFILTAIIVAPIVEEFVKPLVLFRNVSVKGEIDEVEDGIVYGAACGLGFGATENILYGLSEGAVSSGLLGVIIVVALRTVSSILLHLTASSFTGYGISQYLVKGESFSVVVKYYLLAVLIHAAWNTAAVLGSSLILIFSILLAIGGLEFSKRRIRELDLEGSNISPQSLRAENNREDWWNASKDKWANKTQSQTSNTASPIFESATESPASSMFQNIDWRQTLGGIFFLFYILSSIIP
ncbi:MAG: PrsW family intramembrane metalloprotease [Candidatus Thermoplasmatota archaeon]|nr:PrsW family intramembrane metalloprotease [Candidatus Thermoplasmatota archaeon]